MRVMADSITVENLIALNKVMHVDLMAGYVDGHWPDYVQLPPTIRKVSISINAETWANVYDVEAGDLRPSDVPRALETNPGATIYANIEIWKQVKLELAGRALPPWWAPVPGYYGLYPGSIATQYAQRGGCDISTVADFWPGIDPLQTAGETDMRIVRDTLNFREYIMGPGTLFYLTNAAEVNDLLIACGQTSPIPIQHATIEGWTHINPAEPAGW